MHMRMRASNLLWFCDNAEGFARMCLIDSGFSNIEVTDAVL